MLAIQPKKSVAKVVKKSLEIKKSKSPANHPQYNVMVGNAIQALKEHKGSSRQAILKYIMANFKVGNDAKLVNTKIKSALKRGLKSGQLKHSKGTGATGSFRLGDKKVASKKSKAVKSTASVGTPKSKKVAFKKPKSSKKMVPSESSKKMAPSEPKKAASIPLAKEVAFAKPKKTVSITKPVIAIAAKPQVVKSPKKKW